MRNNRTRNFVLIFIWVMIGSVAGYFLYNSIFNGGFTFETKHTGEPTMTLSDVTLDESITSVSIDWISGGVRILPTTGNQIRIVEKSYEPIDPKKVVEITVNGSNLQLKTKNKPLFNFFGFSTKSTYLEVYLPLTTDFQLINLNGVSGLYSIEEVYATLTQVTLVSGNLSLKNSYSTGLGLTMTSGNAVIRDSEILSATIKMTSGKLDYQAKTVNFKANMTSGMIDLDFGQFNPSALNLEMTSGLANITLNGPDAFKFKVDKTSGSFNPNFDHVLEGKTYSHGSGGPLYGIQMTSGVVNVESNPQ